MPQQLITKISLRITYLKCNWNPPGVNELMVFYLRSAGFQVMLFPASVCVCVLVSVCEPWACLHNSSSPGQARITKFGPEVQNTLVKVSVWGIDWWWSSLSLNFIKAWFVHQSKYITARWKELTWDWFTVLTVSVSILSIYLSTETTSWVTTVLQSQPSAHTLI